jgi:hypothetical protein
MVYILKADILEFHALALSNNTCNLDPDLCCLESSFLHTNGRKSTTGLSNREKLFPLPQELSIYPTIVLDGLLQPAVKLAPKKLNHYSQNNSL